MVGAAILQGSCPPEKALQRRLTILLGTEDIDRNDPNLRINEQADKQGLTRFDRGHGFLAAARKLAGTEYAARVEDRLCARDRRTTMEGWLPLLFRT